MFVEEIRRAMAVTPRGRLAELSAAVWKGFASGALTEDEAQSLAEGIEARKAIPVAAPQPRGVGSRPRSPASMERRRRWVSSGWLPPQIACRFTMAEGAVLAVVTAEVLRRGRCTLTVGHIAALAGCCKSTVRSAVRQAAALGLVRSEEWRLSAFRSAPNTITILSPEWLSWLRLVARRPSWRGGGSKILKPTHTHLKNMASIECAKRPGGIGEAAGPVPIAAHSAVRRGR